MSIRKNIEYRNKEYLIDYNFTMEKCLNGNTTHTINILKIDNSNPYIIFSNFCTVPSINQISIIGFCKETIDKYEESIRPEKISNYDEFKNWNGRLDSWDE